MLPRGGRARRAQTASRKPADAVLAKWRGRWAAGARRSLMDSRRRGRHTAGGGDLATGRRIWAAIALACAAWVGGQLVASAVAGGRAPNPVAWLAAADVADAGPAVPASGSAPAVHVADAAAAVPALAAAPAAELRVRVDLISAARAPRAVFLRDSTPVATFRDGSVDVTVAPGDLLEVDGSAYRQPLTFQVVAAAGLAAPSLGLRVTTRGDIAYLGRVRPAP